MLHRGMLMDRKEQCESKLQKCFKRILQTTEENSVRFGIGCETDEKISYLIIAPDFFQLNSKIRSKLVRQIKSALDEYEALINSGIDNEEIQR